MADSISFSFPGDDSDQRRAYRAKVPGLEAWVPHLRKAVAVLVVRYGKSSAGFVMMGASGQREPSGERGDVFEGEFRRDDDPAGPAEGLDNNSNKEN